MPTLNNWSVAKEQDPYLAPECRRSILQGQVTDHPDFDDGSRIWTSPIIKLHGEQILTASGSLYTLGTIDPAYEEAFPGARERLFTSLA
jgi:hypothetical protein